MKLNDSVDLGIKHGDPPYRSAAESPPIAVKRWWLTRRRLISFAIALPLLVVVWWFSAYPRGMVVALVDCASGHYEVQTFGYPAPWRTEFRRLASERYRVEIREVAGCVVAQDLVWYVGGYNSISCWWIEAKFGKDVVTECAEDAQAAWQLAHPRER